MRRSKPEVEKGKISKESISNVKYILKYLKPKRWQYFLGLVFLLLSSSSSLVFPYLLGDLVDTANQTISNDFSMGRLASVLFLVLLLQAIFSFFRITLFANVTESMLALIRQDLYLRLIKMPMSFFNEKRVGELNSRVSSDVSQLQETFTTTVAEFLRQIIVIVGGITLLAITSVKVTLVMLSIVPVVAIAAVFFGRFIRKISKGVQDQIAESNTIVEETLTSIANVKSFANEAFEFTKYFTKTNGVRDLALKGAKWRAAFASFIISAMFGSIILVIWYALTLVETGALTYGDMFRFLMLSVFVGASIGGIAELYAQIQRAVGASERIFEILNLAPEQIESTDSPKKIYGKVAFDNVGFSYSNRDGVEVLRNISFQIEAGEKVAVVGPSGAGKSTIASLLLRFYEVNKGEIRVDNNSVTDYSLFEYRKQVGIVPQEVLLFGGTIYENILYGDSTASEQQVIEAAKKANAWEFIQKFPEGLNTLVGERGVQLSGGQKQRIAIARAILKNPAILILDEATSSLDTESERLVQDALDVLMENRTTFIIAHRLSTVKNADKIFVISEGTIKEQGSHKELMAIEEGIYKNLVQIQFEH